MNICTKCNIDKPQDQFETYWHSTQQKFRTRRICRSCISLQKKEYKQMVKLRKITQPEVPEVPKIEFENHPDYTQCNTCNEWKFTQDNFYINKRTKRLVNTKCKECTNSKERNIESERRKNHLIENCGSIDVRMFPGQWVDIYQQEHVTTFLKLIGWKHNDSNEIWYKPGFRLDDGTWVKYNNNKLKKTIRRKKDVNE